MVCAALLSAQHEELRIDMQDNAERVRESSKSRNGSLPNSHTTSDKKLAQKSRLDFTY